MDTSREKLRLWRQWLTEMNERAIAIITDTEAGHDPENDELIMAVDEMQTELIRQLADLNGRIES